MYKHSSVLIKFIAQYVNIAHRERGCGKFDCSVLYYIQQFASHLAVRMECVMLTLDAVTVLLDSLAPPVMMVYRKEGTFY